ncbi:MAG: O-antigen ligase family protein [Rubrobacter sp.]|nr:O-antigen ligase family protein [Rubrobacter sp.]
MSEREDRKQETAEFWPDNQSRSRFQRVEKPEKSRRPGRLLTVAKALLLLVVMAATAYASLNSGSFGEIRWLPIAIGSFAVVIATLFIKGSYSDVAPLAWILVAALAVLAATKGLSTTWTLSQSETILETIRTSMYLSFFLVTLAALSSARQVGPMMDITVLVVAAIAGYGLLQKIYPLEYPVLSLDGVRMDSTLGYSNTAAAVVAMGVALALSRMTQSSGWILRAIYAPLTVGFLAALYLTVSRGGIGSLVIALAILFVLSEKRLQMFMNLLLISAPTAWLVWRMQSLGGLLGSQTPEEQRTADGLALRDDLIIAFIAAFILQIAFTFLVKRYELMPLGKKVLGVGILAVGGILAAAASIVALVRYGGPAALFEALFGNPILTDDGASRLLSLSIGFRTDYWSVAWDYWMNHLLTGSGAGTFSFIWLQNRPVSSGVQQVHNLYLEQGVETGLVAFLALIAFVAVLVGYTARAAWNARGDRKILLSGLLATCLVYLISSAIEWHWYIPPSTILFFVIAAITAKLATMPDWLAPEPDPTPEER